MKQNGIKIFIPAADPQLARISSRASLRARAAKQGPNPTPWLFWSPGGSLPSGMGLELGCGRTGACLQLGPCLALCSQPNMYSWRLATRPTSLLLFRVKH